MLLTTSLMCSSLGRCLHSSLGVCFCLASALNKLLHCSLCRHCASSKLCVCFIVSFCGILSPKKIRTKVLSPTDIRSFGSGGAMKGRWAWTSLAGTHREAHEWEATGCSPNPHPRVEEGRKKSSWNSMFCIKEWYKGELPQVHDPLSH